MNTDPTECVSTFFFLQVRLKNTRGKDYWYYQQDKLVSESIFVTVDCFNVILFLEFLPPLTGQVSNKNENLCIFTRCTATTKSEFMRCKMFLGSYS